MLESTLHPEREKIEVVGGYLLRDPKYGTYHGYTRTGDHYLGVFKTRREAEYEVEAAEAHEARRES